ncbi:hypothetical protein ACNRWW_02370 [Metabacillus sp. HB246100]
MFFSALSAIVGVLSAIVGVLSAIMGALSAIVGALSAIRVVSTDFTHTWSKRYDQH